MKNSRLRAALAALVFAGFASAAAHADGLTGAIHTTIADGTQVDGNIYDDCCDVYLNGGPGPNKDCDAAGLPDGEYYFQVTNPSGSVLLSNDDIEQRRFTVEDGVIVAYAGTSDKCVHELGTGKCVELKPDNISIQLMPFDQTPNNGNEYKAWATRVSDYAPDDPASKHGFLPKCSKTDNFKCLESEPPPPPGGECTIRFNTYVDANNNGDRDGEDFLVNGVIYDIWYTPPGGSQIHINHVSGDEGSTGGFILTVPVDSVVVVRQQIPAPDPECTWVQTEPSAGSPLSSFVDGQWVYSFTCTEDLGVSTLEFGDACVD